MKHLYYLLALLFVGLAVLGNWLASKYTWPVPFTDLVAPAGFLCFGPVLVIRDWLQQLRGFWWSLWPIAAASAASYLIGYSAGWNIQRIAIASVVAFAISELVEVAIFSPIRKRSLTAGVGISSTVGNAIDSAIFIWIALPALPSFLTFSDLFNGNFIGKLEMIIVGTMLTFGRRLLFPVATA